MSDRGQDRSGRRERGKREKLGRIRVAAHRLFVKQGFERTTTRQIAAEADIGAGTLFLYAPTKEDLLVQIFQDEAGRAVERAFAHMPQAPLLEQLLAVFHALIEFHAADPALARVFVKELPFVDDSRHGLAHFMAQLYARLGGLVEAAKASGELGADAPVRLLVQNLFGIYFQQLQLWLGARAPEPRPEDERLREALELQLRAVRAKE
ncbi:MAG TPA: helix-turn-helix domain-containing protein [Myxococcota bacterium]|nr:helix-turn-helix domain-containing protein [Myxococcota bacterium]